MAKSTFVRAFGGRVRELREQAGLSQEELAHQSGLHRTAITHIERATRSSTLETIEKLARALRVQPATMIPELKLRSERSP